jgi:hypothetical protein
VGTIIEAKGLGSYTFGVVTKGNGYLILDSDEKKDDGKYENKILPAPANLTWDGTTATWDAVTGAEGYSVQLYKNGEVSGSAVSVTSGTSHDFETLAQAGVYTFTVTATGDGTDTLDSSPADSAGTDGGTKAIGSTATIKLIPADESGSLTVTNPGSTTISKGKAESVTLTVGGSGFTGFTWIVDGASKTTSGDGRTLTITAAELKLGGHSVTVYAIKAGVPWSPKDLISINVTK